MEDSAIEANYRVTADELRQFIERFERLEAEKKDIAEQQKEVMAEAKGRGYDTKVMRKVIALRKQAPRLPGSVTPSNTKSVRGDALGCKKVSKDRLGSGGASKPKKAMP